MGNNRFQNVLDEVESASPNTRLDTAIKGIQKVLQNGQNQTVTPAQLGQELEQIRQEMARQAA